MNSGTKLPNLTIRALATGLVVCLAAAPLSAQSPPDLTDIRTRTTFSNSDRGTIDQWIDAQLASLDRANAEATTRFRKAFQDEINHRRSTVEYRAQLVLQTTRKFAAKLREGSSREWRYGAALMCVLNSFGSPDTTDAQLAALDHPSEGVRFLAIKGMRQARTRIATDNAKSKEVIAALARLGQSESSTVVLSEIYRFLEFGSLAPEAAAAIGDILNARIAVYAANLQADVSPEETGFETLEALLSGIPQNQKATLVQSAAKMLRIYVERYQNNSPAAPDEMQLAGAIDSCESFLSRATGNSGTPVSTALQRADRDNVRPALDGWIGAAGSPGKLNASPWNVPTGAP